MNKNVLKKLFSEKEQSVELSEVQKVELALIDDLQKLHDTYSKIAIEAVQSKARLQSEMKKVESELKVAKKAKDDAIKKADVILKAADSIGIEPPQLATRVKSADNFKIEENLNWFSQSSK